MPIGNKDNYQVENKIQVQGKHNEDLVTLAVDEDGKLFCAIQGKYGTELIPVAVDENGNIRVLIQGVPEITGNVNATDVNTVKQIQGYDGTQYRTLAVDSDGHLVAVIKGEYAGALKTVATNEQGFMLIKQLPLVSYDKRGDVVWYDSFENGVAKWSLGGGGAGNWQGLSFETANSGSCSLKLIGGSDGTLLSRAISYFPYLSLSRWGFEARFSIGPNMDKIYFILRHETGTNAKIASILYDRTNEKIQCQDSNGNYQDIATSFLLYENIYLFHVMKLVCNLETSKYDRLILNDVEYDLSSYDMYSFANVVTKHLEIQIYFYSRSGYNDYVYIDDVVVTQNEPAT